MSHWVKQNLLALDQLGNTFFNGWADETMSSHLHRLHRDNKPWGWIRNPVNWIFRILFRQADHCASAYNGELARQQLPPEMRPLP